MIIQLLIRYFELLALLGLLIKNGENISIYYEFRRIKRNYNSISYNFALFLFFYNHYMHDYMNPLFIAIVLYIVIKR